MKFKFERISGQIVGSQEEEKLRLKTSCYLDLTINTTLFGIKAGKKLSNNGT